MTERRRFPYRDPRPDTNLGRVRTALMYLMDQHRRDGALPTSVRFLFYELVMQRVISKEGVRPDKIVSAGLTDLRERGLVRWTDIVDETRQIFDYTGSSTVADDLLGYLGAARLDPWRRHVPFIITESRSLAGVLRTMCRDYRVRVTSTNGQTRGFLHTDVARVLKAGDRVRYLGDWDLAGNDIEANTRGVLQDLVGKLDWKRLALTREQVERYDLPVITKTDQRFSGSGGCHQAVETEALSQALIVNIVRQELDRLLPTSLDRVLVRERRERNRLRRLIEGVATDGR